MDRKEYMKEYYKKWKESDIGKASIKKQSIVSKEYQKSKKGKEIRRIWCYKKKYGITLEDYNIMFLKQNGCCKICGTHQSELTKTMAVDHCHDTGNVRGLLCQTCNTSLGGFKDSIDMLLKAVDYIKNNKI